MSDQQKTEIVALPGFDRAVPNRGYQWWYIDASSDDGNEHLVIIAFVGSVFSPYYARACNRGNADPMDYCAINAALYNSRGKRWILTEKPASEVQRTRQQSQSGHSRLRFTENGLDIALNAMASPLPHIPPNRTPLKVAYPPLGHALQSQETSSSLLDQWEALCEPMYVSCRLHSS